MDEILYLEKFEDADVKYCSKIAFSSSYRKLPKLDKFRLTFKKDFLQEILHFDKLMALRLSMTIVFHVLAEKGIFK